MQWRRYNMVRTKSLFLKHLHSMHSNCMSIDLIKTQLQFLKDLEIKGKSPNTLKNYRADLQVFNKFLSEHKRPMTLKSFPLAQVHEYQGHLQKTYGSPNSIRRRVQALRLYFDFLVQRHDFPDNPIKQMAVAPKLLEKPTPVPFKDIIKLKDWLEARISVTEGLERLLSMRNLLVVLLVYESGIKVSDLARLELSDVIDDKKGLRVLVKPPKRDPYSIPVSLGLKQFFHLYRTELTELWPNRERPKFALFNANPHRILAGSLSPRGTEMVFEEFRRQLKIDITARNLRQAAVFRWMCLKTSEGQIKEWLGVAPNYDLALYLEVFNQKDPPLYLDLPYA